MVNWFFAAGTPARACQLVRDVPSASRAWDLPLGGLDPVLRARLVAALIALILLGLGLMTFAWLLARWVSRWGRRPPRRRPRRGPIGPSDWEPQPWLTTPIADPPTDGKDRSDDRHAEQ